MLLNHLFFADDYILFGTALTLEAEEALNVVSTYKEASGQRVNFDKSLLYFSMNMVKANRANVALILHVRITSMSKTYLGLLMMVGHNKNRAFQHYMDRLKKRLDNWSLRLLLMRGKEVCIKVILQAISVYAMQCFLFPLDFFEPWKGC